ncbi:MAG TPA: hypothetical protein VFE60_13955 [Roseiarcus sp.]|nr:hypothetical protein [Roseiarcus sp.]
MDDMVVCGRPQEPRADLHVTQRPRIGQAHRLIHRAIDQIDLGGLAATIQAANPGLSFPHTLADDVTRALALASASSCASWRGLD